MIEEQDVYSQLQKRLNDLPVGFPTTETGIEISILKRLFTSEEAKIATQLGFLPEPIKKIQKRLEKSGINVDDLESILDNMAKKGLILGDGMYKDKGEGKYYGNALYAIGIYDFQLPYLTKEFINAHHEYIDQALGSELSRKDLPMQIRTIPVEKSLMPDHHVGSYDNVRELVESSDGPFAVMECICRKGAILTEDPCKNTNLIETCITLEEAAKNVLYLGYAKEVKKGEALEILTRAQDEGLILQPSNSQKPLSICACCGDCCHFLTAIKKLPKPADHFITNFYSEVDSELCQGCSTCVKKCQMGALSLVDDISRVNLDFCIGCGNCVTNCPSNAIHLVKKSKEYVPPKNYEALYKKILMKKKGLLGSLKIVGKMIMGKQI